jgi:hypothetical protein
MNLYPTLRELAAEDAAEAVRAADQRTLAFIMAHLAAAISAIERLPEIGSPSASVDKAHFTTILTELMVDAIGDVTTLRDQPLQPEELVA